MKKLLAVLLSVVMTMCLTVPAFAAPAPGAAPEAGSIGVIGGADGPAAIITTIPGGWANTNPELDQAYQEMYQAMIDAQKEALGGVPGQIGVMVNGEYVQFPDAVPEMKDGCVMVPIRALAAALGGQVAYGEEEKEQLVKAADKTYLTFTVNSSQVIVEYASGDGELVTLSCAPYIKNDRAYVPVRFMGEILGYEVGWDSAFQTAILLDREALAAEIDKNFTILNKVQAGQALSLKDGESCSVEMEGSVTVTAFDTLNGDKNYTADLTGKTLMNNEAASGSYSITLSKAAVDALTELMGLVTGSQDAGAVRAVLENLSMDVILNNEGLFWLHAPILDQMSGAENIWLSYDMGAELAQLAFTGTGTTTVGSGLAALMRTDSAAYCAAMAQSVKAMTALYGDKNFTTSGGVSTCTIGVDELADLITSYAGGSTDMKDLMKEVYKEYNLTMKVDSKGAVTVTAVMETAAQTGVPGIKMTMDCTQSGGKAGVTMEIHVANLGEMTLELTATQKTTSEKPMTEPPAGAAVIDIPASLNF